MFRCWYCHNDDDPGCDCGACGIAEGHGYHWCVSHGCRACDNKRAWPWRRVFWQGLVIRFNNHLPVWLIEWLGKRRLA